LEDSQVATLLRSNLFAPILIDLLEEKMDDEIAARRMPNP